MQTVSQSVSPTILSNKSFLRSRRLFQSCLIGVILLFTGCSPLVVTDYDTSYDFSRLKVYAWNPQSDESVKDPLVDNDLMYGRVTEAIEDQLVARGFSLAAEGEGADFFIGFHIKAEEKFNLTSYDPMNHPSGCWPHCYRADYIFHDHFNDDIQLWQYKQGVFMVDVIDPATERLIWRGSVSRRLSNGTPERRTEYVNEVIASIFSQFPAGTSIPQP